MSLPGTLKPPAELGAGRRFFLLGYLPTYAALMFLLVLVWAGARAWAAPAGAGLSFKAAWETTAGLGAGELMALLIGVTLLGVVLNPLQLPLVRAFEGSWPRRLGGGMALRRQGARKRALESAAQLPQGTEALLTSETVQRAGQAGQELRRRFPLPDRLLRPTALGNALAAVADSAGRAYGLDAVAAWPRLYPVLGAEVRALVDDRRDGLDGAVRIAAVMTATAAAAGVLLLRTGWWLLLALLPLVIASAAYRGAVQAALGYGETVQVAFDLHRADLLKALRLAPPARQSDEHALCSELSDFWRQGIPLDPARTYAVDGGSNGGNP
ncbi:hypothetical protein ACFWOG_03505 [Kitasatospora sp. NPDC058406]|uniref:hypothetical protein n=1 Tax=Kitasatospora sp. NPDC058406 TaxID=3346483 RepID=UPI003649D582